jgi:hypothetical protein
VEKKEEEKKRKRKGEKREKAGKTKLSTTEQNGNVVVTKLTSSSRFDPRNGIIYNLFRTLGSAGTLSPSIANGTS